MRADQQLDALIAAIHDELPPELAGRILALAERRPQGERIVRGPVSMASAIAIAKTLDEVLTPHEVARIGRRAAVRAQAREAGEA